MIFSLSASVLTNMQRRGKQKFIFSLRSRAGANHTGQRKTNQDSYITITNLGDKDDRHLFGVCDGHGMNGHFVSAFCKENIPGLIFALFSSFL